MNGFYDNFVLNSGTPHYSIDSFSVALREKSFYDATVYVKQRRKGPSFTGDNHIMEVMFMDDNWNRFTDTIHFDGQTGSSVTTLPFWPAIVLVDPEEKMCDATTDNYRTIKTTGNYTFDKTFFSMEVENISDSAFVQATHNWAPPDSLREPVAGLRLSDYRYWRIDGIFPEGFHATGKFFYSAGNYLDNTLITSSSDTIIIIYRRGALEDWQEIEFEKIGQWNIGYIVVHDLKAGEYTLAVKEAGVGSSELLLPAKNMLEIYPNPSSGNFTIISGSDTGGEIRIYSNTGALVKSIRVTAGLEQITWAPEGMAAGSYLIAFYGEGQPGPEIRKVFYLPGL